MDIEKIVDKVFKEVVKQLQTEKREKALIIGSQKDNDACCAQYDCVPFSEADDQESFQHIIITEMSNKMLFNLANGNYDTPEEEYILNHLLQGKRVRVSADGVDFFKYKDTAPKALYETYLSYYSKLKAYGISFVTENEHENESSADPNKDVESPNRKEGRINKRIITELDLQKQLLEKKTYILIPEKSIITPLADDYLKKHRMEIQRYEENEA